MLFNKKYFLSLGILVSLTPAMQAFSLFTSTETKLQNSVTVADVATFTKELEAYKASHDASAFKALCSELNNQAETTKKILQDELAALGEGKTVNAWQLAKGIGQTIIGSAAAISVSSFAPYLLFDRDTIQSFSYSYYKLSNIIRYHISKPLIIALYLDPNRLKGYQYSYRTILAITAYQGLKHGITNIKTGYNYRQYLEQQITNLDEIIKIIEVAQK
ncbi:MAG TPA: hypothetical protein PLU71_04555 [Candidatus Dependentiae bacterium]|nr:hypothetical protein [Candidatus Dependentiae bacterium]HRQ63104.1 hypothetical protein [Candidatus Dependentiae bacterium]